MGVFVLIKCTDVDISVPAYKVFWKLMRACTVSHSCLLWHFIAALLVNSLSPRPNSTSTHFEWACTTLLCLSHPLCACATSCLGIVATGKTVDSFKSTDFSSNYVFADLTPWFVCEQLCLFSAPVCMVQCV